MPACLTDMFLCHLQSQRVHFRTENHPSRNRATDLAANPGAEHDSAVLPPRRSPGCPRLDGQPPAPVREGRQVFGACRMMTDLRRISGSLTKAGCRSPSSEGRRRFHGLRLRSLATTGVMKSSWRRSCHQTLRPSRSALPVNVVAHQKMLEDRQAIRNSWRSSLSRGTRNSSISGSGRAIRFTRKHLI